VQNRVLARRRTDTFANRVAWIKVVLVLFDKISTKLFVWAPRPDYDDRRQAGQGLGKEQKMQACLLVTIGTHRDAKQIKYIRIAYW
jgi:hypothetical protein